MLSQIHNPCSVALVSTKPQTVLQDYMRLLDLLDIDAACLRSVVLLSYSASSFPQPATFTTPWQLEGTVLALRSLGAHKISMLGTLPHGDDLTGLAHTAHRLGLSWQAEPSEATLLVLLPTLRRLPGLRVGGALWLLHQGNVWRDRSWFRGWNVPIGLTRNFDVSLLRQMPVLAVMDATTVGNGANDNADRPQIGNLLLAARDAVALDSISARLLGFEDLRDVPMLQEAHNRGLGIADIAQIQLYGDREVFGLRFPPCPAHRPWRSRSSYRAWRYETGWGKLFCEYIMS